MKFNAEFWAWSFLYDKGFNSKFNSLIEKHKEFLVFLLTALVMCLSRHLFTSFKWLNVQVGSSSHYSQLSFLLMSTGSFLMFPVLFSILTMCFLFILNQSNQGYISHFNIFVSLIIQLSLSISLISYYIILLTLNIICPSLFKHLNCIDFDCFTFVYKHLKLYTSL